MTRLVLPVKELASDAFAPYGRVVDRPKTAPDAAGPGWRWWSETAFLAPAERRYGVGYLDLRPEEPVFDWAERHMASVEMLIPVGGDCLVYVGPAVHPEDPGRLPALERFEVFRVRQGRAVILEKGVWHGAPMAVDRPLAVVVLLRRGTGAEDVSLVRFADTPVRIEI